MMTTQSNPKINEIQTIWQQYQGLYIVGGILIGLLLFPFLDLVINDLSQLLVGLVPEAIGIGFTVFFLDRIYQKREIEVLKKRLIREAGSRDNSTAISAIDWLREEKWLDHLKGAKLNGANLESIKLKNLDLKNTFLMASNLKNADLVEVDLEGSYLQTADLQEAQFTLVNLAESSMEFANLLHADMRYTHMKHARLMFANLTVAS